MNESQNGTILQNLRDFTVQIRDPDTDRIHGTGLAITMDGKVITCAHVIYSILTVHPRDAANAEIGVYFPQARGDERKAYRATVAQCFPSHDDDVVVLQLDAPPPLGPEQLPILGTAEPSAFHPFRSFGFRRLAQYQAGHAHGTIFDAVPSPEGYTLHTEPIQLESNQINQGMSGAGILDVERNLVVGLIAEVHKAKPDGIDQGTSWGINARVLTIPPLAVALQDAPLPKAAAPQPQADFQQVARQIRSVSPDAQFHAAPPPLAEWVGRTELLAGLTRDYDDPNRRVTGLIGFGGEGKSSLARKWVDLLLAGEAEIGDRRLEIQDAQSPISNLATAGRPSPPTGIFWWGFYDNQNVDEFFEAALDFVSGGQIDPTRMRSSSVRAQVIAAMLANERYLFVLDGLEVLQRQEGDEYGLLRSPDLQTFLELFAAPGHSSFCLITSRAPLLDLLAYTSYTHRDVGPVSVPDGRALLRQLGVTGPNTALDQLVRQWDGHALTLSLLGSFLKWQHDGDITFANEFNALVGSQHAATLPEDAPDEARQRYSHVHRVLRRYDEHLTVAERAFMTLFSAFRTPVAPDAFARVFRGKSADFADDADEKPGFLDRLLNRTPKGRGEAVIRPGGGQADGLPLQGVLAKLDEVEFEELLARLVGYRLLRHNEAADTYTTHPLVRSHYLALLTGSGQAEKTHDQLKDYYLALAGDTPHQPTLADLAPLIEVVYHACRAGAYDEAWDIYWQRFQAGRAIIIHILGAYETNLNILFGFFRDGNTSQEPQVSKANIKSWILNEVGLCLMNLGRLATAVPFYERAVKLYAEQKDWSNASAGYQNLADLNANLGRLAASATAAEEALTLARRAENKWNEGVSLAWKGWSSHLIGEKELASKSFEQMEDLYKEHEKEPFGYSLPGIQHAEHLRRVGQADYARRVTAANLEILTRLRIINQISMCHRVLGELDADAGGAEAIAAARDHFDTALTIARSISFRAVLIEALLARGRWAAKLVYADLTVAPDTSTTTPIVPGHLSGLTQAFSDLREALGYATDGGYRRYEADSRTALAWAHLASNNPAAAKQEASRAQTMSIDMGYHWGQVDATEVLALL
ncbi:MAG: trypsin-like peptidase domain-containing protein [Ardenticatenaceae bacterium]|nr:trypsin-like peptidase domain-containing protein [Ardenticatenaceae bacterium]